MRASSWARTTTWRARSVKRSNTIRSFSFGVQQARELARVFVRIGSFAQRHDIPRSFSLLLGENLAQGTGRKGPTEAAQRARFALPARARLRVSTRGRRAASRAC